MIAPPLPAIAIDRMSRWFGKHCVVKDLTFHMATGQVTTLLGLNGAGKTTTMRVIMGLIDPTRGTCRTLGIDTRELGPETLARIGYLVEGHYLPNWMRVHQVERFCERFRPTWDHQLYREIVEHFGIRVQQHVGHLSRGQRAGVSLASVLAGSPELLVLDDPSLGLDPVSRRALNETLLQYITDGDGPQKPRTILLSTHQLDDVERIADNIAVMIGGQLWVHTSLNEFQSRVARYVVSVAEDQSISDLIEKVQTEVRGVVEVREASHQLVVCVVDSETQSDAEESLRTVTGGDVEPISTSLDDRVIAYLARERQEHFGNRISRRTRSSL